jgi:hypothetical protein
MRDRLLCLGLFWRSAPAARDTLSIPVQPLGRELQSVLAVPADECNEKTNRHEGKPHVNVPAVQLRC